jgi:O-antigen ligase
LARLHTGRQLQEFGSPSTDRSPLLLRLVVITIFAIPANMVLAPLGAVGYVAMVLAILLFALWLLSALMGLHDPIPFRHPGRVGLGAFWLATVIAYVAMGPGPADSIGRASADRWLLIMLGVTGVAMVTAESTRTEARRLSLVRTLVGAMTFCSVIAIYQFVTHTDPDLLIRPFLVGLSDNGGNTTLQARSSFFRVAGTTFHPIELGVVATMILPMATWRALFDPRGHRWWHWSQTGVIAFASFTTVSRSAILALFVACLVAIPFLPGPARKWASFVVPAGIVAVFSAVPGLIATLTGAVTAGSADPSITTRTDDYARVEAMVVRRPLAGIGPGTFIPKNPLEIVDNQYLHTVIEMGLIGLLALLMYLLIPGVAALLAARNAQDRSLRCFSGAVAAAGFIGVVASATFDSLSFPVFNMIFAVVLGLSGSVWMSVKAERVEPVAGRPGMLLRMTKTRDEP